MKLNHMAGAALAALTLGAALPASAQDYGRDYNRGGYGHGGWRHRGEIRVRTPRADFAVNRGDRLFYRLLEQPYNFRPGFTYVYSDRCTRDGCDVLVLRGGDPRPVAHLFAPRVELRFAERDDRGAGWGEDDRAPPPDDRRYAPPPPDQNYGRDDHANAPPDDYATPRPGDDAAPYDDNGSQPDPDRDLEGGPYGR